MADALALGVMGGGVALAATGAGVGAVGLRQLSRPPEFTWHSFSTFITATDYPGGAREQAPDQLTLRGHEMNAQHEFASISENTSLERLRLHTRDANGSMKPTRMARELADMSLGKHGHRTLMLGIGLITAGIVAVVTGSALANDNKPEASR